MGGAREARGDGPSVIADSSDHARLPGTPATVPVMPNVPPVFRSVPPAPPPSAAGTAVAHVSPALLLALQRSTGNRAVNGLLSRSLSPVQRQSVEAEPAAPLGDRYRVSLGTAGRTGDYREAAQLLNGFNRQDILSRLAELPDDQLAYMYLGAVGNPAVGPDSQLAQLTRPGAPRASTAEPVSSQSPARPTSTASQAEQGSSGTSDRPIADWTTSEKLLEALHRADIDAAVREKILSLVTPEALAVAIVSFAATFVASQFTPVGWAADIALGLTAIFVGTALFAAANHLINFADARNATTSEELDAAGAEFARAVAEVEIDAILFLVTHATGGGGARPGAPVGGPPSMGVVLATSRGQLVFVAAETIPVAVAGQLAVAAGGTGTMAMSALSGGNGPTGGAGSTSGGGSGGGASGGREAERTFIERLKERYPALRQLDIRPRARPSASAYTSAVESPEVGGGTEYRTEVSGAPEHAFEERMQTSQGGYSYSVFGEGGRPVLELDGISVDGWLEEVKINQNMGRLDDILAQLRTQADFAETYGLRGVRYSISPPEVAAEVESRVAEEGLRNVYRAE